jgi:bifunctional non-homologous end joining protein LigD
VRGVTQPVTHPDRVIADGITKGDVVAYYADVAEVMLPELRRRALTMERFTKGIAAGGFFQKHAQKHYPPWIERATLGGKTKVTYPVCDTAEALVYFANQGGIAFHIWTSRVDAPAAPDVLVFDLDPPDGGFEMVRITARLLERTLGELDLPVFVKTTGSKGLHVVVPLDGAASYAVVEKLASAIAARLCAQHPELLTTEFYKKDRKGRLFLDTMRNAPGATFVTAYSLRGRPALPVSAPIAWDEVDDPGLRPDQLTLRDLRTRLDRRGDPWATLRAREGSAKSAFARLDEHATHGKR